jgi:hypothetical protein
MRSAGRCCARGRVPLTPESMGGRFDFERPELPNREVRRIAVDFPAWMVAALDGEAARIGVSRQDIIEMWMSERLDDERAKRAAERQAAC